LRPDEPDIRRAKAQARLHSGGFVPNIGVFSRPVLWTWRAARC
jgi:hypothetical protein